MESISKRGKIFHGKFAETAIKIGLAKPIEETEEQEPEVIEEVIPDPVKVPEKVAPAIVKKTRAKRGEGKRSRKAKK